MKTSKIILLGLIVVVAAVMGLFAFTADKPQQVRIAISGTSGLAVKGTYTADGITHEVVAIVPTNIFVKAREVSYSIQKGSEAGELKVELSVHCTHHGSATTSQASGGCQGALKGGMVTSQSTF